MVTAQKRTQSLQDVPIAMSAFTGDELDRSGINDVLDVAQRVPSLGVQVNRNPLSAQYRIRGIGNLGNIPNFEPEVAYYLDGAFRSRSGLGVGALVDVDRIEILKGPQSALYGKNSTVGVIAVHTREPGRELQVTSEATASNVKGAEYAGMWLAKAAVSGPVAASLRLGVSASYYDQDSIAEDPRTGVATDEMRRYACAARPCSSRLLLSRCG